MEGNKKEPPPKITFRWCPECGLTDRFSSMGSKYHWAGGKKCPGKPVRVAYIYRCIVPDEDHE